MSFPERLKSRKLWNTWIAQAAAAAIALLPEYQDSITEISTALAAIVGIVLAQMFYVSAQGAVDKAKAAKG